MPAVSILIPAYKPDHLAMTLASASAQNFTDLEILVGDDTPDGRLREIVESVADPRIRYFHHGFRDGLRNSQGLWAQSSGRYVKWLYDDDLLMATSVETLVGALELHPESALAFHERVYVDGSNKVVHVPPSLTPAGETALLSRRFLVEHMVVAADNFIGEPSNVMMVRERVDPITMMRYRGRSFAYLTDDAMYLRAARAAPLVLVGGYHGCFRRHAAQNSSVASPTIVSGFFEWEIMVRAEAAAGQLSAAMLTRAQARLNQVYTFAIQSLGFTQLEPLRANLGELTELPAADLATSPRYVASLADVRDRLRIEADAAAAAAA